jgi:hypothetical protein
MVQQQLTLFTATPQVRVTLAFSGLESQNARDGSKADIPLSGLTNFNSIGKRAVRHSWCKRLVVGAQRLKRVVYRISPSKRR